MAAFLQTLKILHRSLGYARLKKSLKTLLPHDTIYSSKYYTKIVEGPATASADAISESIVTEFEPGTVVDVGCGTGALLEALRRRGCRVFGLEYSRAALEYCRVRGLDVLRFDLENDQFQDSRTFDVAVSLEVAEHLPGKVADRYVDLLTRLAGVVVFTAAPPGQGGTDHVNEQPPAYWISRFRSRGFAHDEELSRSFAETWKARDVVNWYHRNLMIFRRERDR